MTMVQALQATDVRNDWSQFIDGIVHGRPQVIKRNHDYILSLSVPQAKILVKNISFKAFFIKEDDGSTTAGLEEIDLCVNEHDEASALESLAKDLIDYAHDYFDNFQLYFNAPNRQQHFPYVLAVLLQDDPESVKRMIHA